MAGYCATAATCEWETPIDLFSSLDNEFHFDLDPCCTEENKKCELHYTKEDDGLIQNWGGHTVFCNPPYGREIADWVQKASESNADTVMLIPSRTDTKWFHEYIYKKDNVEIRFLRGRLRFGNASASAPFPSMLAIFRNKDRVSITQ